MNTKNSLEERILDDFRQLPEELRGKFLLMIRANANLIQIPRTFAR